jgi:hypothetical protein
MNRTLNALAFGVVLSTAAGAAQAGCLTGAAVGGVAGHVAGHHAVLGAAAGCVVGHHMAVKKKRELAAERARARAARQHGQPSQH